MIEITVNIPALDRLVDVLKAGVALPGAAADVGKLSANAETKPASRGSSKANQDKPAGAAGAAEQPKTDVTAAGSATTASRMSPSDDTDTAEDLLAKVKEKAMTLSQKKGRDTLIATLKEFDATNVSGIAPDQQAAFIARVDELVAE